MTTRALVGTTTASALALLLVLTACGSASPRSAGVAGTSAPSRTQPYLVMRDANIGVAVWPSGDAWLVLSTTDGFAHVTNRTPQAVDTGGGMAVAATGNAVIAVVGTHERLTRSPVLTADASWRWQPDELPGAVSGSRNAASAAPRTVVTTAHHGTLTEQTPSNWRTLTSAAALSAGVSLNAVTWSDARTGWLTGTASSGAAVYSTRDAGASWSPVPESSGTNVGALAPCGAGRSWELPLLRKGSLQILRTSDAGLHWTPDAAVASATPLFGCSGSTVWVIAHRGNAEHLMSSADSGVSWRDQGATPPDVVDVQPAGSDAGYAVTDHGRAELWRVTKDGSHFRRIMLPKWVASIGRQLSGGS